MGHPHNLDRRGLTIHRTSCHRKNRYKTEYDANKAIKSLKRHEKYDGLPLTSYECTVCRGYHIGHLKEEE